jgi:hypothetical protein
MEADNAKLHTELARTRSEFKKVSKQASTSSRVAGEALGNLAARAAASFARMAKEQIDNADAASKMARSFALTTGEISVYETAARRSNLSTENLRTALSKVVDVGRKAAEGNKTTADALDALGVSALDASGNIKPVRELLGDLSDAFAGAEDSANKTAVAQVLFGDRVGAKLIPFLNMGRAGFEELNKEMTAAGTILTDEAGAAAEAFNDNMDRLNQQLAGVTLTIVQAALPALETMSTRFVTLGEDSGTLTKEISGVDKFFRTLVTGGVLADTALKVGGKALGAFAAQLVALMKLDFKAVDAIDKEFGNDVSNIVGDALAEVDTLWDKAAAGAEAAGKRIAEGLANGVSGVPKNVIPPLRTVPTVVKTVTDKIGPMLDALQAQADTLGFTATQTELYKLQSEGASSAQIALASALRGTIDEFEAAELAQEDLAAEGERLDGVFAKHRELITGVDQVTHDYQQTLGELVGLMNAGRLSPEDFSAAILRAGEDFQIATEKWREGLFDLEDFGAEAAQNLQGAFADFLFNPFEDGVQGMLKGFGQALQRMIADAVAADLFSRISGGLQGQGGFGGALGGIGSALGSFAGFFANGGDIPAGSFGIAGETGQPELVTGPATVHNPRDTAAMLGSGSSTSITVNVSPQNSASDMRRAAGQGAREALAALNGAKRYG